MNFCANLLRNTQQHTNTVQYLTQAKFAQVFCFVLNKKASLCQREAFEDFWWRRGRVELPVQKSPPRVSTSLFGCLFSLHCHPPADFSGASRCFLGGPHRHRGRSTSTFRRPVPNPSRRGQGGRSCLVRQLGRILFRQLLFCHLFYEVDGTSACNSELQLPCRTTRPHKSDKLQIANYKSQIQNSN